MQKDFDKWNKYKKTIDAQSRLVNFHEREIWWCSVGVNVGSEQDSYSKNFVRPTIIVKKFTDRFFWGVQHTSTIRGGEFRVPFKLNGNLNDMLLLQLRSFDSRRLISRISVLPQSEYESLLVRIIKICLKSMKTPYSGVSEAEARVCTQILSGSTYESSIKDQETLSRFFGDRYYYRLAVRSGI